MGHLRLVSNSELVVWGQAQARPDTWHVHTAIAVYQMNSRDARMSSNNRSFGPYLPFSPFFITPEGDLPHSFIPDRLTVAAHLFPLCNCIRHLFSFPHLDDSESRARGVQACPQFVLATEGVSRSLLSCFSFVTYLIVDLFIQVAFVPMSVHVDDWGYVFIQSA